MGAAVGKLGEGSADAPKTLSGVRLAVCEWNRSASSIWDADGNYTNRNLLIVVDEVLRLAEDPSARPHLNSDIAFIMSRMAEEILHVRVWNASKLRVAIDGPPLASSGPSAGTSTTSTASTGGRTSTASTGGELDASESVPYEVAALMNSDLDELDLVSPAGVSVLHEIARRVIRAGSSEEFLRAFADAPCDVLDSFLTILECPRWTTEVVIIKRWSTVAKLVEKAVVAMRRQLYAQNSGAFRTFRDEYIQAIAESRILVLLEFVEGFTRVTSHDKLKLLYTLGMYEALSNAAPSLLLLFSGEHKQHVSERTQDILIRLADEVKNMVSNIMSRIQSDSWRMQNWGYGIHPLTQYAMIWIERLAPHRTVLGLILANGGVRAPAEAAERVVTFRGLVAELIEGLERNLEEKSALICGDAGGSAHLFLANNISFVLNRAADTDVASLLGDEWASRRQSKLERHAAGYAEASWGPVVACLETGKPAKALAKFNAAFKKAHGNQAFRAVRVPVLRAALRKIVSETVVPAYIAFLRKYPKLEKSVIYSADDLAESLSELFEGEAAVSTGC